MERLKRGDRGGGRPKSERGAGGVSDDTSEGGKQSESEGEAARDWKRKTDEVGSGAFSRRKLPSIKCSASKWGRGGLCCRKLHYLQPQLCQSGHRKVPKELIQDFIPSHQITAALGEVFMGGNHAHPISVNQKMGLEQRRWLQVSPFNRCGEMNLKCRREVQHSDELASQFNTQSTTRHEEELLACDTRVEECRTSILMLC